MTATSGAWVVDHSVGLDRARAVLSQDRFANAYALCDLEPPFDRYTTVAVARRGNHAEAACLVVRHPDYTGIVTHGHPDGLHAILAAIDLPHVSHVDLPDAHRPIVERFYHLNRPHERHLMVVDTQTFRRDLNQPAGLTRLDAADQDRLVDLYTGYDDGVFYKAQLQDGPFFGVRDGDRLLGAGGTVGIARQCGIAVVVSIFVRPEARRRGLGAAITSAITSELFDLGCRDVCLDVDMTNTVAIRVYERLGFRPHSRRWQGPAEGRSQSPGQGWIVGA